MNKKIVTIYYVDDWKKKGDPISSIATRKFFENMHESGLETGVEMYRASIKWYNVESGFFEKVWAYRDKKWIRIEEEIKPDLIFDKVGGVRDYELFELKMKMTKKVKIFNHPLFRVLCDNKLSQYMMFSEFMPKSFLITEEKQMQQVLRNISTSKVVVKPLYGSGGFGILIAEKENLSKKDFKYPVILQEFIKSEKGIPGFSNEGDIADLRMVFFNHKFRYAISRIAKNGSLFTNFHQGASAVMVPADKIPQSVNKIAEKIVERLLSFGDAQYSLDFMFDNNGKPFLIEMNTTPGVDLLREFGNKNVWNQNLEDLISVL